MNKFLFFIFLFLFTSYGTTQLVTYNSNVEIYVNKQFKGKGQANITRTGPPKKAHIEAKYNGEPVGSLDIRRQVKFTTVIIGIYTYGIGFLFSWKYPETVIIPVDDLHMDKAAKPAGSIWDLPPGDWRK